MMGVNTRNMYSCLQKCNKLNKSHLVGKLLNSIHDAWTHVYKMHRIFVEYCMQYVIMVLELGDKCRFFR